MMSANKNQQQSLSTSGTSRHGLYLAVACSLLGMTSAHWGSSSKTVAAFATSTPRGEQDSALKRERESQVRLFSRGPDMMLSATASVAYTGNYQRGYGRTIQQRVTDLLTSGYVDHHRGDDSEGATAIVLDPFDPNFRPQTQGSTSAWGPSPISVNSDGTVAAAAPALPLDVGAEGQFKIFCDLDGVLVDFESGVQRICQRATADMAKTTMWSKIAQSNTPFFAQLPWMPDGEELWKSIQHLKPDILTGVPDLEGSCRDKYHWCQEHLDMTEFRHVDMAGDGYLHSSVNGIPKACPDRESHVTNVITCWSYNKHHESGQHAVLIDDRIALKESWEAKGGIFVHHTDTASTLQKLRELGILEESQPEAISSTTLRP